MENTRILIYDGSFNGFLCAVYTAFNEQITVTGIQKKNVRQKSLFAEPLAVLTDLKKAKRVWQGIDKRHYQAAKRIYFAFLSESKGIEMILFRYIRLLFAGENASSIADYSAILNKIELLADLVAREKKHIEGMLNLQKDGGQLAIATIDPEYNVLPLISRYYRSLFPHTAWVIYDSRRSYGLYYHEQSMELLHLSPAEVTKLAVEAGQPIFTGSGRPKPTDNNTTSIGVRKLHQPAISMGIQEKRAV